MRVRATIAAIVAAALIAGSVAPSDAAGTLPATDTQRALALLDTPCLPNASHTAQIAQVPAPFATATSADASPNPAPSGSPAPGSPAPGSPAPSATPSLPPAPIIPSGPGVLVPPALPSSSPGVTPPPLPTPSPVASVAPGPVYVTPVTPTPPPTPQPVLTAGPIRPASASPSATPAAPNNGEAPLRENEFALLYDKLTGTNSDNGPFDLDGNVNIIYLDGTIVGDHAHHEDQSRYIDVTGHTSIRNRAGDTTLAADAIRFDTLTQRATLINGRGVSTQGVESGRLHYSARTLITQRNGTTHGDRASLTTCENPRSGYHIEAKTLDLTPGDKAVLRAAVLFLGPLAILYIPVLVIPLNRSVGGPRRNQGFIPVIGYSAAEGFYVKARIGFSPSDTYFGYYRIEGYTKIGFGLGYVASFRPKNQKRSIDIDFFTQQNTMLHSNTSNFDLTDQENFSQTLRGTARVNYQGDYGPLISLPASLAIQLGLAKTTAKDSQNFSYARQSNGSEYVSSNYGFSDQHTFSSKLTNALTATFTSSTQSSGGFSSSNNTLHFDDDAHYTGRSYDYDLTVDRYDSTTPSGVNKLPELLIRPHGSLFPRLTAFPTTATYTIGEYSDPTSMLATQRAEAQINVGPVLAHTILGDFNASVNVRQDAYGTGDEKAQIAQNINLTTPITSHINSSLSYTNQHVNGLGDEPFVFDTIGGAYKNLQEVLRIFNGDVYALTLQSGTAFNRMAQGVSYQLLTRPSPRSALILGGVYTPGPGNGFDRTSVQASTPLGRGSDIQISTFVDWKARGRFESKTIYFRRIVGDCYEFRIAYNQDNKTVNFTIDLLAFPSQAVNFGLGQQTSIIPQSFATDQYINGAH